MKVNELMRNAFLTIALVFFLMVPLTVAQDDAPITSTDEASGVTYTIERYVPANFPVGMVFAPDGHLFYNEKNTGNVRVVLPDGMLQQAPVITFEVDGLQERGLLGIALDPAFEENTTVWVYYTAVGTATDWPTNKIVRFQLETADGVLIGTNPETLFELPIDNGLQIHNGGNLHFDQNDNLVVSIGDYGDAFHAQDLSTPHSAIHRFEVTDDGLAPASGNPFDDSSIYAYGFRNPWDFAFDPQTGQIWATENGPSCDDELNLVLIGFNYGWDEDYACYGTDFIPGLLDYEPPMLTFTPTIGITGVTFLDNPAVSAWHEDLFFCDWVNGELHHVELDDSRSAIADHQTLDLGGITCKIDILTGPDGALYFSTVGDGEGWIYRLIPHADNT